MFQICVRPLNQWNCEPIMFQKVIHPKVTSINQMMDGEHNAKNSKSGEDITRKMEWVKVEKEVDDYDVMVKIEVEMLDDKEYLGLKLAKAEQRVSELEKEKVGREEEMGEVVRVGRAWRRVAEEWRGEVERSDAAARYWRGKVEEWRETAKDQEKSKGGEDKGSQTGRMYKETDWKKVNILNGSGIIDTIPVHLEAEDTANEQMEIVLVPRDEVLASEKPSINPRRYSRRIRGHGKQYGGDGDQAEDCYLNDSKNPGLDGEDEITKSVSPSSKPSTGAKRKASVENDPTKALYTCPEADCKKKFGEKSNMTSHVRNVHRGERPYRCPEADCKKKFGIKSSMASHVRNVHRGERPYCCPEQGCKKKFGQKINMKSHVLAAHSGERPFGCPEAGCKERFGYKISMESHVRTVHMKQRPFVCPKTGCKDRFGKKREIPDHLRAAHGDPKLVCGVRGCTSEFLSVSGINKHKKKTHKDRG